MIFEKKPDEIHQIIFKFCIIVVNTSMLAKGSIRDRLLPGFTHCRRMIGVNILILILLDETVQAFNNV